MKQIGKIPVEDIKKDLKLTGMSEVAVDNLLQVLSIKSLEKLEGQFLLGSFLMFT